jgi:oxygen-dependent protoporphyrinogen oxidase
LGPAIKLNHDARRILRQGDCWEITAADGKQIQARRVILACPTYAASAMLRDFDRELADALDEIPYAPIVVVATGHRREDVRHPLDGFGFLVPRNQGLRTLGSIWTSTIFAGRAPDGHVQFRSMLGGAGDPSVMELSDDQLWDTLRRELGPLLEIHGDPAFMRIYRWQRGIPQFTLGHRERRAGIERLAARRPGLHLIGNAYYGVSLNDCVKMAHRLAQEIRSSLRN